MKFENIYRKYNIRSKFKTIVISVQKFVKQ